MKSDRTQRRPNIIFCVAAALISRSRRLRSFAPPTATISVPIAGASDSAGRRLQLGVGQSVIFDLPEEAGEIYVADPGVANAIVRSAKRVYISGVANGQTSIFALARDGRRIATIQISVGRNVAELSNLLNTAIPGNEIHVRTSRTRSSLQGPSHPPRRRKRRSISLTASSMIRRRPDRRELPSRSPAGASPGGANGKSTVRRDGSSTRSRSAAQIRSACV